MILYIILVFSSLLLLLLVAAIYKILKLKAESGFFSRELEEKNAELIFLKAKQLENIQKIEFQNAKIDNLQELINNFEKLRTESYEQTKHILFELSSKFTKDLIEAHKKESQENAILTENKIKENSERFNSEFERLVSIVGALNKDISSSKDSVDMIKNSLLSPSGAGYLAEITLENILKSSGLRSQLDFILQYSMFGSEQNSKLRPDAVVFLPTNNLMIIDAKASKFLLEECGDGENLSKAINAHLKSLSSKEYALNLKENLLRKNIHVQNVVTLMFVPTEHAIEKIMNSDPKFMNKAWDANIFPVGPSGLMNMLSFAKFQISEQLIIENHKQIIEEVKKIISSISLMTEHSKRLGSSIQNIVSSYDKFAASFNRNFLSKVKVIKNLGVEGGKGKKTASSTFVDESLMRYQLIPSVINIDSNIVEDAIEDMLEDEVFAEAEN